MQNITEVDMDNQDSIGKISGFFLFQNLLNDYTEIKLSEEERKKSKKFGFRGIIWCVFSILLSLGATFGMRSSVQGLMGFQHGMMITMYVFAGTVFPLLLGIYGMIFAVMQLRLNRKTIGIIAIIISVLTIINSVGTVVWLFV